MKNEHGHKEISAFRNERDQRDTGMGGAHKPGSQDKQRQDQRGNKNPGSGYNNPSERDQNRKASEADSFGKVTSSDSDC